MKKEAWPTTVVPEDKSHFMEPTSGPMDMAQDSQELRGTFNPGLYLFDESELPEGYEAGIISPVDDVFSDDIQNEFQAMAKQIQIRMLKNSNLLSVGNISPNVLESIYLSGINIYSLNNLKINKKSSIYNENSDLKYHNFNQEFDGFFINLSSYSDKSFILKNIFSQLKPYASGFVVSADDISNDLTNNGYKISWSKNINNAYIYDLLKDEFSEISIAKICKASDNSTQAIIKCKVAESWPDKVAGLQVYDHLPQDFGLIFKYDKPESVTYHMGKVAFPIDIVFIDENFKIKKISKNIKPGSLELFSCSDVLNVLEINGGMSDSLGISVGDYAFINTSFNKSAFDINNLSSYIKYSSNLESGIYKYANSEYFVVNKKIKNQKINTEDNNIFCDFDSFFDSNIRLARISNDGRTSISFTNDMIKISNDFINMNLLDYLEYKTYLKFENKYALNMYDSIPIVNELKENIKNASINFNKIIFLSSRNPSRFLTAHLLRNAFGESVPDFDFFYIPNSCKSINQKTSAILSRYKVANTEFLMSKKAGIPVPDEVKINAKKALDLFTSSIEECKKLIKNFEQNRNVYQKVAGQLEVIENSKGQYQESCKRNSEILVKSLVSVRDGIKIMNTIKDISYTDEIISSVADASKAVSEGAKAIFELINTIDMPDFFDKLGSKTNEFNNLFEDFSNTIERIKKFINTDILGVKVLIGD